MVKARTGERKARLWLPGLRHWRNQTMQEIASYIRFRLYLGHNIGAQKNAVDIVKASRIVSDTFPGFTSYAAAGHWQGNVEASTVFEILLPNRTGLETVHVRDVAQRLKVAFSQESVLMTAEPVPMVEFL